MTTYQSDEDIKQAWEKRLTDVRNGTKIDLVLFEFFAQRHADRAAVLDNVKELVEGMKSGVANDTYDEVLEIVLTAINQLKGKE